jgi:hypothetical protein
MTRQNHADSPRHYMTNKPPSFVHLYIPQHVTNMEKEALHQTQDGRLPRNAQIDKDIVILIHHRSRRQRFFAIAFTAVAFLYLCFSISRPFLFHHRSPDFEPQAVLLDQPVEVSNTLVPLEAHIMSKCPDAKVNALLSAFILPLLMNCSRHV